MENQPSKNKLILPTTIILASIILGGFIYASQLSKQQSIEKQNQAILDEKQQTAKDKASALNNCLLVSAQNYADTWNNLCEQTGKNAGCSEFIGSPKDIEFTKIKQTADQICYNLYK